MPVVLRKAPERGNAVIGNALRDLQARSEPDSLLGGASITFSEPLPVYRLGLNEITGPESVERAQQFSWRYLVEGASGGAGFADVRETPEQEAKFASFSQSVNANRLLEAAHLAQDTARDLPDDVEARILEIPALYTSAIWLAGRVDIFIPYIGGSRPREAIQVQPNFLHDLAMQARDARLAGVAQDSATVRRTEAEVVDDRSDRAAQSGDRSGER